MKTVYNKDCLWSRQMQRLFFFFFVSGGSLFVVCWVGIHQLHSHLGETGRVG